MAKRGPSQHYALTLDQVQAAVQACQTLEDRFLIKGLLYLGLRVGELAHARRTWISENKALRIPPEMPCSCPDCSKRVTRPGIWKPKSKAGSRVIPLVKPVQDDLLAYLYSHPSGISVSRVVINQKVKRILTRAKISFPEIGGGTAFPHALRATCATILASTPGMTASQLCYIMGWSELKTAEHYIQVSAARSQAAETMERAFS